MTVDEWLGLGLGTACLSVLLVKAACWRTEAKRGLILTLLLRRGEMTGLQLRNAGVGGLVYNLLNDLVQSGLVERREKPGDDLSVRGGRPLYYYRIRDHWIQTCDEDRRQRLREAS